MRTVRRYLGGHACGEHVVAARVPAEYDAAVVIPVRAEEPDFVGALRSASTDLRVLAVVVVNARVDDPPVVHARNASCLRVLARRGRTRELDDGVLWVEAGAPDLLLVDRSSPGRAFGARDGVGLARRIGGDIVTALWAERRLRTPWIHNTDADAELGRDHFAESASERDAVALTHTYWHEPSGEPALDEAVALYEIGLRWYVAGLGAAKSWWAYSTLGSCMSVRVDAYAAVRGMPRRQAAEDFYLLGKVAKLGSTRRPEGARVRLASRASDRVPFGTGPGVRRLMAMRLEGRGPSLYHPDSFVLLAETHRRIRAFAADPEGGLGPTSEPLAVAWHAVGLEHGLRAAMRSATSEPQRLLRAFEWFDAFRTLKLVHALRDRDLPPLPWREALGRFEATEHLAHADGLDAIRNALAALEPTTAGKPPSLNSDS